MARYKNGINGAFSGKVGNVVGANCRGIDYMRSLPDFSEKAPTEKQLHQRLRFALVMGWLKPLLGIINVGYKTLMTDKTQMNRAVSYHLKQAVIGDGPNYSIDFRKAIFSRGELLVSWVLGIASEANAVLKMNWGENPASIFSDSSDKATFIFYNPEKQEFVTFKDAALRGDTQVELQLPVTFAGDFVYGWMQYTDTAENAVSTSLFLGKILIR